MSAPIAEVLRTLPTVWRQAAAALDGKGNAAGAHALRAAADATEQAMAMTLTSGSGGGGHPLPAGIIPLLTAAQAARFLGVSLRHLADRADVPRVDVAPPGASRRQWRYRHGDLLAFADRHAVAPYQPAA